MPAEALADVESPAASESELRSAARRRVRRRRLLVQLLRVALGLFTLGSWELTTRVGLVDPFFYGQPSGIYWQIVTWVTQGTPLGPLWRQVGVTMEETLLGFVLGVVLGVVFGLVLGSNRLLADIFAPYIKALNAIPRIVLGGIFSLAFGLGLKAVVALAIVLVFFVVFFNAFQGVREVDANLIANARILGAGRRRVATEVIIPSALTWIIASLHTAFGFALVGAVVGEFIGATEGVGVLVSFAKNNFDANSVFAAMVILAVVALLAEYLVTALENRLLKWRPNAITDIAI